MHKKHETNMSPTRYYCFVNITKDTNVFKFYVVPSNVVGYQGIYFEEQGILIAGPAKPAEPQTPAVIAANSCTHRVDWMSAFGGKADIG